MNVYTQVFYGDECRKWFGRETLVRKYSMHNFVLISLDPVKMGVIKQFEYIFEVNFSMHIRVAIFPI